MHHLLLLLLFLRGLGKELVLRYGHLDKVTFSLLARLHLQGHIASRQGLVADLLGLVLLEGHIVLIKRAKLNGRVL